MAVLDNRHKHHPANGIAQGCAKLKFQILLAVHGFAQQIAGKHLHTSYNTVM